MWLGIDVGSVSTKMVVLGEDGEIHASTYLETAGNPVGALREGLNSITQVVDPTSIKAAVTTGSGRSLARVLVDAQRARNEITCQIIGILSNVPGTRTILEIGGQDSKCIQLDQRGVPIWYNMNSICSSGTGAYLKQTAARLEVLIEELGPLSLQSTIDVSIAGRCSVFAESDLIHKQQMGIAKPDLMKGLCRALARNFLNNVARNHDLKSPIVFSGGVARNIGVVKAFEDELEVEVTVPDIPELTGAIGAARLARQEPQEGVRIDTNNKFESMMIECRDCANYCEISEILRDGEVVGILGSRCDKWSVERPPRQVIKV